MKTVVAIILWLGFIWALHQLGVVIMRHVWNSLQRGE